MNYEPTWLEVANSMVKESDPGISGCFDSNITGIKRTRHGYELSFGVQDSIGRAIASQMFVGKRRLYVACLFMDVEAMKKHEERLRSVFQHIPESATDPESISDE